jgi:regulator of sigma E protease
MTAVIFIIVLAVLIFVHELGHFLAAKAFGIRVDAFKLGFGPKIFAWRPNKRDGTPGETEYGVNWIPFGGYVKIFGEDPDGENTDQTGADSARSFALKARWKQAIVLASGVLMNFIFAWLLYICVFASGVTASSVGFEQYSADFHDPRIMITTVMPGSPAEKVGLKEGDMIRGIFPNGTDLNTIDSAVSLSVSDIQNDVDASKGNPIELGYSRGGKTDIVVIAAVPGLVQGKYAIGIAMDNVIDLKLPFFTAIGEGFSYTLTLIKETVVGLYTFIADIVVGHPNFSDVAGPIGIAGIVGNAAALGFTYLLMITALISVNLGVINLIPFPALDGGRILFVAIESAIRRRINAKFTNAVNLVGFGLLVILMILVTWQDVARLIK